MDGTFTKTMTMGQILNDLRSGQRDPMRTFEEFPIKEIREECISRLQFRKMDIVVVKWLEDQALGLLRKNDYFAKDVLSFYLFNTKEDEESGYSMGPKRAIKYLTDLKPVATESTPFSLYDCSKMITGRLFGGFEPAIEKYEEMKYFLSDFFGYCLDRIYVRLDDGYPERDWACAQRALRVFLAAKDCTHLKTINELIAFFDERVIRPSEKMPVFSRGMHYAALIETRDILEAEKKKVDAYENHPDKDEAIPF